MEGRVSQDLRSELFVEGQVVTLTEGVGYMAITDMRDEAFTIPKEVMVANFQSVAGEHEDLFSGRSSRTMLQ